MCVLNMDESLPRLVFDVDHFAQSKREREKDKERGVLIGGRAEERPALTQHYLATPTQL